MGYAFNLCKSYIYNVPYNHNIAEEGIEMTQDRIRIVDVADALGLSTATVSKVIHGKTEKISDETVKRVQQELERSGYIPNMAGILLARNTTCFFFFRLFFTIKTTFFNNCCDTIATFPSFKHKSIP